MAAAPGHAVWGRLRESCTPTEKLPEAFETSAPARELSRDVARGKSKAVSPASKGHF